MSVGEFIQLRCRHWRSDHIPSLLLVDDLLLEFGPLRQSHPNGREVNHRSLIRGAHHLTSANEVVLRLAAILVRVHSSAPADRATNKREAKANVPTEQVGICALF